MTPKEIWLCSPLIYETSKWTDKKSGWLDFNHVTPFQYEIMLDKPIVI